MVRLKDMVMWSPSTETMLLVKCPHNGDMGSQCPQTYKKLRFYQVEKRLGNCHMGVISYEAIVLVGN